MSVLWGVLLLIVGMALTFGWVLADLPLGPGAQVFYTAPAQVTP